MLISLHRTTSRGRSLDITTIKTKIRRNSQTVGGLMRHSSLLVGGTSPKGVIRHDSRRFRRHLHRVVAPAAIAAMVVAGSAVAGSTAVASAAARHAANKSPIKIGYPVALTGTDSLYPTALAGERAAVAAINKSGGIHGHKLVLDYCDVKSNVNEAESCTRKLISDGVVAFVGTGDNYGPEQEPIEKAANVPDLGNFTATSPVEFNSPIEFPLTAGATGTFAAAPAYGIGVAKPKLKSFDFVGVQIPIVEALAKSTKASILSHGGTWSGTTFVPESTTTWAPYVAAAAAKHADITILSMAGPQMAEFALAAEAAGDTFQTFYLAEAVPTSLIKTFGPSTKFGKKLIFASYLPPWTATKQYPLLKKFIKDIKAEYAAGTKYAAPSYYSIAMEFSWYAVHAFDLVASKIHGKIDAKSMLHELRRIKTLKLGLTPAWSPNVKGPKGFLHVAPSDFHEYMLKIVNGHWALAYPKAIPVESYVAG